MGCGGCFLWEQKEVLQRRKRKHVFFSWFVLHLFFFLSLDSPPFLDLPFPLGLFFVQDSLKIIRAPLGVLQRISS